MKAKEQALAALPIDAHLPAITAAVRDRGALVIVAEPGAGKTTRVPRALMEAGVADRGEIVVLQPRRLATRLAARRVAEELGEKPGERVGWQVRFENVSSPRTRVRFVTEGILTARLAGDPELRGVAAVVLDELHERNLHGDLALAWVRRLRATTRPDLAVVAMSATLDADAVARYLGCEALHVPGRQFEVAIEHAEKAEDRPLEEKIGVALRRLINAGLDGSILVFLPGAGEIRRARDACQETARRAGMEIAVLHGDLPPEEQDRAVRPGGAPKLILSTNVAETSVTIDGVVAVIDSGLARVARHSPWSGLAALELAKISQASAAQRAGRAGRTRPGRCVRLYTRHDHDARPRHDVPEILRADLAETVLALHGLGVPDARGLGWLDPPAEPALRAAEDLLARLGATAATSHRDAPSLTPLGRRMSRFALHPRLARVVLEGEARGVAASACLLAAIAAERDPRLAMRTRIDRSRGGTPAHDEVGLSDLVARMHAFESVADSPGGLRADRIRAHDLDVGATLAIDRAHRALKASLSRPGDEHRDEALEHALLLATLTGFPDRVARRRAPRSDDIVFAGGGAAKLAPTSVVREAAFVVAIEAEERRGQPPLVRTASAVEPEWLLELFPDHIRDRRTVRFDPATERVEVNAAVLYDDLVLDESRAAADSPAAQDEIAAVLADAALARGPRHFCDPDALDRFLARAAFAREHDPTLAALDDDFLRRTLRELASGLRSFAELRDAGLLHAIRARFTPAQLAAIDRLAPDRISLPRRPNVRIEYDPGKPPWLASRLQDFFGLRESPRVAGGRVPLVLHLLAPNQRAVQVTTDLAGFWEKHYPTIRRELMRRYPRHAWPETP